MLGTKRPGLKGAPLKGVRPAKPGGLSVAEFDIVRALVLTRSGIALDANRKYLADSRLGPLARKRGVASASALVAELRRAGAEEVKVAVVEAMTTNETSFFRDVHPFEAMRTEILPEFQKSGRPVKIWCAACSTGQEPYSLSLLVQENFPSLSRRLSILATDISEEVLAKAKSGRFSQLEVNRGLPATMLVRYFKRHGREWEIADKVRGQIEFRFANLLDPKVRERVDIVFLRNVLIYFKEKIKQKVLANIKRSMKPGAILFLGGAETIIGIDTDFETIKYGRTLCYRLKR